MDINQLNKFILSEIEQEPFPAPVLTVKVS